MVGSTISHYTILEKLGEGGMGIVYKAQDTKLDRIVALKFLPQRHTMNESDRARFLQEAKAASQINHPNVCTIYDIQEEDDELFIVMEFVDGKTLHEQISTRSHHEGQLPIKDVVDYALQIAEALQEAHSKEIIHRDIKSENIMVNTKNQIKVMDFGLAKLKGSLKLTRTSSSAGTLAYMSPEQIQGGEANARSDIFSFGIVLFEMLTGKLPFRGEHEAAMIYSILNEDPYPVEKFRNDVPGDIQYIITRCLEKDPSDRYQSVFDILNDLRRIRKQTDRGSALNGVYRSQINHETDKKKFPKKNTRVIVIISVLVVAVFVFLYIRLFNKSTITSVGSNLSFRALPITFSEINYPGLSADGNWVVFPATDMNSRWDIYVINASGGDTRRLTNDNASLIQQADISPDGANVIFAELPNPSMKFQLKMVPLLGGVCKTITEDCELPRWRPDGRVIGFVRWINSKQGRLLTFWTITPDRSNQKLVWIDTLSINSMEGRYSFAWAPDGESIAWVAEYNGLYNEVVIVNLTTGKTKTITSLHSPIDDVCWTSHNDIIFSSTRSGNTNLWFIPVQGGEAIQLTRGSGPDMSVKISANGQRVLYFQHSQSSSVWYSNSDGSNIQQLTQEDQSCTFPFVSPDGKVIAYEMDDPDVLKSLRYIYTVNKDGSEKHQWTSDKFVAHYPAWSPDNKWLLYNMHELTASHDSMKLVAQNATSTGEAVFLGGGGGLWFADSSKYFIHYENGGTALGDLSEKKIPLIKKDSIWFYSFPKKKYGLIRDFRSASPGLWLVRLSEFPQIDFTASRNILSPDFVCGIAPSGDFLLFQKNNDLWKMSLPDGKEVRFQNHFPHISAYTLRISQDGKEMVFAVDRSHGKLVVMEGLYK